MQLHSVLVLGQDIFITDIEVRSNYNASYLTSYSNVYLYKIVQLERRRITSVIREFESSGLFDRVQWSLEGPDEQARKLILTPVYPKDYESFVLNDVILDQLPDVDSQKFKQVLSKKGIKLGSSWHTNSYSSLVAKIKEALLQSVANDAAIKEVENPWVSIRCLQPRQVSLIVRGSSFDHMTLLNER
jgi:hypothetical protein